VIRLVVALAVWITLALVSYQVVQRVRPEKDALRHRGLTWLREEYHIPEDNFRQIVKLHEAYFARCDKMCADLLEAHAASSRLANRQTAQQEHDLCEHCLNTMIEHLQTVASLMPPQEGRRFLATVLPEVSHPPELQDLRLQAVPK
jgi:hypothetical protein